MTMDSVPSVLDSKDTEWLLAKIKQAGSTARDPFAAAKEQIQDLSQRAQQNPNERDTARKLARGLNLPAVRAEIKGFVDPFMKVPSNLEEARRLAEVQEREMAELTRQYPHDMRQLEHIRHGYLNENDWRLRQDCNANLIKGMGALGTVAHETVLRLMAKGILAAQERGDFSSQGDIDLKAGDSGQQMLVKQGILKNPRDIELLEKAGEILIASRNFMQNVSQATPLEKLLPDVDIVRRSSMDLYSIAQSAHSTFQFPAESPTPAMQRESIARSDNAEGVQPAPTQQVAPGDRDLKR